VIDGKTVGGASSIKVKGKILSSGGFAEYYIIQQIISQFSS
jgi:hypothetical protein